MHIEDRARYRITVQGALDERWSDWLEGLSMVRTRTQDGLVVTILEGDLIDQSALVGVLNHLLTLSMPITRVECLDRGEAVQGNAQVAPSGSATH